MLDWFLIILALAAGGGGSMPGGTMSAGSATVAPAAPGLVAEPQVPTGKFTTATEVKPILTATKANWVAIRDYDGQDLLYVTHLLAWRCGLVRLRYGLNGGELVDWPMPACHENIATPNALLPEDGMPFAAFAPSQINSVTVEITYDDLSTDSATFQRSEVMMP